MFSLGTKSREEAKRRRTTEAFRTDLALDDARAFVLSNKARGDCGISRPGSPTVATRHTVKLSALQSSRPNDLLQRLQGAGPNVLSSTSLDTRELPMLDTTIHEEWVAERKPRAKGADTYRRTAQIFYERVGRKPVRKITKQDVLTFKKSMVEDGFTNANIKNYLARVKTLLKYAVENDYIDSNPAADVNITLTDKDRLKRRPFDLTDLNTLFGSPVYLHSTRPAGGKGDAAYWLPLLALYTGARLEELGQLRLKDIVEEKYVDQDGLTKSAWCILIRKDQVDDLTLKNDGSERVVPIHLVLVQLGLLRYADSLRAKGEYWLFTKLKQGAYGRRTAKWGEWFSSYLRTVCLITDPRIVFHSFRHTFKDFARHVGMPDGLQRAIMGHSGGDVADSYGSGYSLHQLVEAMKSYWIPGLKLGGCVLQRPSNG